MKPKTDNLKPIAIGIFGVGHLGKIHVKLLKEMPQWFRISGFYDPDESASQYASRELGLHGFNHPLELVQAVDVVLVASPTATHFDLALLSIENNKHVFIEKPVCANETQAAALLQATEGKNLVIQVGHVERFNPVFTALMPHLGSFKPQKMVAQRIAPFTPRGADVSVVHDLMIHDLDLAFAIAGKTAEVVFIEATGEAVVTPTLDIAHVRLIFDTGFEVNLEANRCAQHRVRGFKLMDNQTCFKADLLHQKLSYWHLTGKKPNTHTPVEVKITNHNAIAQELTAFACAIANQHEPPLVNLATAYKAMHLSDQICQIISQQNQVQPLVYN
ncbi:MAG: Gfo/Idh/MocA family oxidoreductase [Sphingobacteriales bacterium]|jgi:predicted dehydrogenase|nr:Gfo/Idh/MocA family oxidoreductase [Sphingobacteriales bacterium]MBP9141608.1 Gfo/Idh/MocA family oxidoreductase [Chitinophagales bacterium]MDA0198472.1 Gfo/Idh/MocA family oxidoreductase [Bacteroidota bacterium]MBK6890793.1 Gfo/Idh/MocA family oxidoreductase [Sphingobacteriales bacterium]MBK7526152.1 Gfo/Idh/MocA family oxidoreductase [Sphingobacteriales bacterium]